MNTASDLGIYWALRLFLFGLFIICGYAISFFDKKGKDFWYYAITLIIFYSLIEGLRFDRGVDYYHYYLEFIGHSLNTPEREPLYKAIVSSAQLILLPYWGLFIGFSCLLITSFLLVIRCMPRIAFLALPLFFFITDYAAENLIRQFIALSFLYLAYYEYLKSDKIKMYGCLIAVPLIHLSGLFGIILFLAFQFFPVKSKYSLILVIVYIIVERYWKVSNFDEFSIFLQSLNISDDVQFSGYIEDSDRWFTEEGSLSKINNTSGVVSTASFAIHSVFTVLFIWFATKVAAMDKRWRIPFWCSYFYILISAIGGDIELYGRFGWWLKIFYPIMIAAMMTAYRFSKMGRLFMYSLLFLAFVYPFLRTIGTMPYSGCAFVWDLI